MAHAGPRAHLVTETGSTGTAPGNKWDPFFGTPDGFHQQVRADDQLSHETYNLPKAYEGKNKRLEDILDFMIRQEDEFYTRDLMPWEYTDDIHIVWDVWKFNRTLADVVPEQGISRLVTQENERHTDNLVRRGLAFQLEHGFMTTDKGRRNYALNLQQISDAVHTTCYFGVMHALFAGQNYYKEYRRKFARYVKGPRTLFRHERQMWACLQKDIKGVYIMDAEIKHHMKINGIVPDVLVLPPKAGIYISMVPPSETTYSDRGPGAHEALTADRTGITTFRGNKVFEAQSFDVDFQHDFVDLTSRPRMCGEYFVIPGTTAPHDLMSTIGRVLDDMVDRKYQRGALPAIGGRSNGGRSAYGAAAPSLQLLARAQKEDPFIHIYSAEKDDYVKITYSEANAAAQNGRTRGPAQYHQLKDQLDKVHAAFETVAKQKVADESTPANKKAVAADYSVNLAADAVDVGIVQNYQIYDAAPGAAAPGLLGNAGAAAGAARRAIGFFGARLRGYGRDFNLSKLQNDAESILPPVANQSRSLLDSFEASCGNAQDGPVANILHLTQLLANKIEECLVPKLAANARANQRTLATHIGRTIKQLELALHMEYLKLHADQDKHNFDILLLRPFQTYTMHSAIMAKGGSDLGNTYHGHHDFQLSDNVATKTHFGNYTFYSKPVVKRPRNYTIIPDCFAQGYISGEGHAFFQPPSDMRDPGAPGDLGRAIQEGSLGSADCHHSLIAWRVPRGEGEKLADAIDITGRFAGAHRDFERGDLPHFTGADALGALESIEELDQNRTDEAYLHQVQHVNTVCFRGAQYTNGKFTHHGKGHWGTAYAGVLPVRDGALMYMDPSKEPQKGDEIV